MSDPTITDAVASDAVDEATEPDAGPPQPAEPTSESVAAAVTDPAGLSASAAAAAKRAETAAAVAMVAAVASAKAKQVSLQAEPQAEVVGPAPRPSRLRAAKGVVLMVVRGALVLALFVAGIALGNAAFLSSQPTQPTTVVDPAVADAQPPAVVREFVEALRTGESDVVRSALPPEPHLVLVDELKRFDIQRIVGVETLSTHIDGPRSATEIVLRAMNADGIEISVNLVVLSDGNMIEGFR